MHWIAFYILIPVRIAQDNACHIYYAILDIGIRYVICNMQYLSKRDIFGVAKLVLRPVRPVQDTTAITLPVQFTHTPLANWSEKINALQSTKCESASTDYYQKFLNCFECLQIGICRGISTLNCGVGIKLQCLSFRSWCMHLNLTWKLQRIKFQKTIHSALQPLSISFQQEVLLHLIISCLIKVL